MFFVNFYLLRNYARVGNEEIKQLRLTTNDNLSHTVALAEWLRRVPAKYMGSPRESSNLSGDAYNFFFPPVFISI
jgi:hypothetical protein